MLILKDHTIGNDIDHTHWVQIQARFEEQMCQYEFPAAHMPRCTLPNIWGGFI